MSSSANRRPRVAGQRRRPARMDGPGVDPTMTPGELPDSVETDESDEQPGDPADPADPSPQALPHRQGRDRDTDDAMAAADDDADGPEVSDEAASETTEATETAETTEPARGRRLLVPALALAASLVLLASVLFVTREDPAQRARDASAASATARSTLEQILSYNHATMTAQIPAGQALLTGAFKDEFASTMTKTIVPLAQKDKTVVKARAYEVGVMSQTDDSVTVQAFVNQARTSDAQKEPSIDQNRVIATMTRVGDRWLVSSLKAY